MAEHYLALYRKYRPQTFQDVCGRDAIVRTLKNQIISGRIGHSYLFCGTRGTGKTSIAKIFARAVNCENPQDGNPCCECASCRAISEDANLNVVEMDAASNNGVEDIRTVIDQVSYSPTQGKYRVFIIDEVHMLSTAAFNALLKTLEEPPSYAIFILATTEPNKLPVTILSRCQRYDFGRLPAGIIEERLRAICEKEGLTCEDRALRYIATAADGSMRDGLSILDQCNAFNYGNDVLSYEKTLEILGAVDTSVFSRLFRSVHIGDAVSALKIVDEVLSQGRELVQFVTDYIGYLRNVMLLKASGQSRTALDVSEEQLEWMLEDARAAEMTEVIRSINVFSELTDAIRYSSNRRILTETAVIRLCEPSMDIAEDTEGRILSLMERVRVLEERLVESQKQMLSGGYTMAPAAAGTGAAAETPAQNSPREEKTVKAAPVLPEAIPEDIKKVAAAWNRLISQIPADNHMAKIHLLSAKPTLGEDGKLLVVFENYINADYFLGTRGEENRQYFSEFLKARTGKDISVEYKLLDNQEKFTDNYVDIRGVINMEIVEEDD